MVSGQGAEHCPLHGFAVAECGEGEYQLRRLSDGAVLPAWFPAQMLRPVLEG